MEVAGLNVDVMVKKVYGEGDEGGVARMSSSKIVVWGVAVIYRKKEEKKRRREDEEGISELVRFQHCSTSTRTVYK